MELSLLGMRLRALARLIDQPVRTLADLEGLAIDGSFLKQESQDEMAAEHYRVLTHDMVPAASLFLERKAMLGGAVSGRVREAMEHTGFAPDTSSYPADHLVNVLLFLAHLADRQDIETLQRVTRVHVLSWMPLLIDALSQSGAKLFNEMGHEIELAMLGIGVDSLGTESDYPPLMELPFDMDKAELAAIGIYLATPIESGLFISKARLAIEARSHRLPTGFGTRAMTIEGLFRSAGQYEAIGAVCDFFDQKIESKEELWKRWSDTGAAHWSGEWAKKLANTRRVIETLREAEDTSS